MLPHLRIAASSPVPTHRALLARVLASTRLDRGDSDPEAFAPLWSDAAIAVTVGRWAGDEYDLLALDDEVWRCFGRHGRCELRIVDDGAELDRLTESARAVVRGGHDVAEVLQRLLEDEPRVLVVLDN